MTPSGTSLQAGQHVVEDNMNCSCPSSSPDDGAGMEPTAHCSQLPPPPTTPPTPSPPACRLARDGTVVEGMRPGEHRKLDGCTYCSCDERWQVVCASVRCAAPLCVDSVVPAGGCCAECPHGQ